MSTCTSNEREMVKIKVCGITNLEDAEAALDLGADALGFNFYPPSPRSISPERARAIIAELKTPASNIALFVNESRERVRKILEFARAEDGRRLFTGLQFHGEESGDYCLGWGMKVIKAFRIKEKESLRGVDNFPADYYLVDSWSAGYGGSGAPFPWEWLQGINPAKLILSGGLSAENVADAVRRVHPYGIDVCSGVEARPGVKDHAKLKEFILAAQGA